MALQLHQALFRFSANHEIVKNNLEVYVPLDFHIGKIGDKLEQVFLVIVSFVVGNFVFIDDSEPEG